MKAATIKKVLILVTILAVPGFLYYLLQEKGKNRYKTLAYYGTKKQSGSFHSRRGEKIPDTTYHSVGDFAFINQKNDAISIGKINNTLIILNLFYLHGGFATNTSNSEMSTLYGWYGKNPRIRFLSVSVDPTRDNASLLDAYASTFKAKAGKWDFLTTTDTSLYAFINEELLLDVFANKDKIAYSNMFILLDHERHIRGFYDATNKEAVAKLDDEVKVLMTEELRNLNDGR